MKRGLTLLIAVLALMAATCGQDSEDAATASSEPETTLEVRGSRYCELLVVSRKLNKVEASVYPTFGINDCPPEIWDNIDADALAEDLDAVAVSLNGPRFFVMDELTSFDTSGEVVTIAGLEVRLAATVSVATDSQNGGAEDQSESGGYGPSEVQRNTEYVFNAGTLVYELVSPQGDVYVMQSFSHIVDNTLTIESLSTLTDRISPPDGWDYRARQLDDELRLRADGLANVVQDELANSYQLVVD